MVVKQHARRPQKRSVSGFVSLRRDLSHGRSSSAQGSGVKNSKARIEPLTFVRLLANGVRDHARVQSKNPQAIPTQADLHQLASRKSQASCGHHLVTISISFAKQQAQSVGRNLPSAMIAVRIHRALSSSREEGELAVQGTSLLIKGGISGSRDSTSGTRTRTGVYGMSRGHVESIGARGRRRLPSSP